MSRMPTDTDTDALRAPAGNRPGTGTRPTDGDPAVAGVLTDGALPAALARARGPEPVGPDTPAGPRVSVPPGPGTPVPAARPDRREADLDRLLRAAFVAGDPAGRFRPAASAGALHPVDVRVRIGPDGPL
ncbi:hypothetical protein FOE67_19930, partial [Streptomyces calidiresistens]|nr:hypothetical protein [Streptomyces calidiresistens]